MKKNEGEDPNDALNEMKRLLKDLAKKEILEKGFNRTNLVAPEKEPTIDELIREGEILLEQEEKKKKKSVPKKKQSNLDPLLKAREIVLDKLPKWRKDEFLQMEKEGNKNNEHYNVITKLIVEEYDNLTP